MRILVLATAALLVSIPLAALAPAASAFGYCTQPGITRPPCSDHVVCIGGGGHGTERERCQYGVPSDVCDIIVCGPGPVLP